MDRRKGLATRIERIHEAVGNPLNETDLPDDCSDPFAYFTDENGTWDHEEYARLLLETRGTAGPAWVGLRELDELQERLAELEDCYLRLWELVDTVHFDRADRRELAALADRIENDAYVDRQIFDSIQAQLITLGEVDLDPTENRSPRRSDRE